MNKKINIYFRQTSNGSGHDNERPLWFDREKCFKNLLDTIDNDLVRLVVVFDGDIESHFTSKYDGFEVVNINAGSDWGSFTQTLDIIKKDNLSDDSIIYLLENDYLHIDGWCEVMADLFNLYDDIGYVSLYDHFDKYIKIPDNKYYREEYQTLTSHILTSSFCHWRTVPSTCGTFAMTKKLFDLDYDVHMNFPGDYHKFISLGKERHRTVLTPILGYSTHVMEGLLSPFRNWEKINNG